MDEKDLKILGPVDTAFFYTETPESPMNIGAVSIFEGRVPFDEVVKTIDSRLHRAPIYQQKIVQAPLSLGQPMWAFDPDFHIGNHMFRTKVAAPGTEEQLRQLVSKILSSNLDRSKPLWEVHMIEGLQDDRTAFFFKVHHAMVDGLAAVEIFTLLFDLSPDVEPIEQKPLYDPPELPSTGEVIFESFKRDLPHKFDVLKKIGSDISSLANVFGKRNERRKTFFGLANVVNDNIQPIKKLPINGKNSGEQELAWVEFSLAEVRAIKSKRETSVNDVMLSILAGAIERYSKERNPHLAQEFLRILIPVSMRLEKEKGDYGNRISVLTVDVDFDTEDPLERLKRIRDYTQIMKDSSLSNSLDLLLTVPSLAPSVLQPLIWNVAPIAFSFIAHTWCTNVPGPQIPVYIRGHKLLHNYGFFPLNPSMGLACVIVSYNQRISMTLVADKAIVPDVTLLRDYLEDSFLELRSAAKIQPIEPINIEREPSQAKNAPPPTVVQSGGAAAATATQSNENGGSTAVAMAQEVEAVPSDEDTKSANGTANHTTSDTNEIKIEVEAEPVEAPKPTPEPETEEPTGSMKIFSEPWAAAYHIAINENPNYYRTSTKWTHGPMAFVMQASPRNGYPEDSAVILDLHKGKCRSARSVRPAQAYNEANFVIEGSYENWMKALRGEAKPLGMLVRGQLKLKKGPLTRLMPFTQSAQELINSAQTIK